MRLIFGIAEIDGYDYRGDRIRTCDLVLPKHSAISLRLINISLLSLAYNQVGGTNMSLNLAQST